MYWDGLFPKNLLVRANVDLSSRCLLIALLIVPQIMLMVKAYFNISLFVILRNKQGEFQKFQ